MAENKLLIGSISIPANTDIDLRLALEDFVRKVDDTTSYLFRPQVNTVTADYTASDLDSLILADASGGAVTVTLPAVATVTGKQLKVKKTDSSANAVTVDGTSTEKIDGSNTFSLAAQYKYCAVISDGSAWHIVANN